MCRAAAQRGVIVGHQIHRELRHVGVEPPLVGESLGKAELQQVWPQMARDAAHQIDAAEGQVDQGQITGVAPQKAHEQPRGPLRAGFLRMASFHDLGGG